MKEFLIATVAILFLATLFFMARSQQGDFEECSAAASARYPASSPRPAGQPYRDVYQCMIKLGYRQDSHSLHCEELDYTAAAINVDCYRSDNTLKGFAHDLATVFR